VKSKPVPASFFGMVLGLSGLGQAWRLAATLWAWPPLIGEAVLTLAALIWLLLLLRYGWQAVRDPARSQQEFLHPVQGSTPALLGVATLLMVLAVLPHSRALASLLLVLGLGWHLGFALWHSGILWKGGREGTDTVPTLYLPTVAGNFTSAAALGALGHPQWGWLFLGAGFFSWLALESQILQRLTQQASLPVAQRPLLGIQFAPPVVCLMAALILYPGTVTPWLLMLWGYGLFQLLLGLRLWRWLGAQRFAPSYWAYTFGVAATTVGTLKLALAGAEPARLLALPIFIAANLFIGYLTLRTAHLLWRRELI